MDSSSPLYPIGRAACARSGCVIECKFIVRLNKNNEWHIGTKYMDLYLDEAQISVITFSRSRVAGLSIVVIVPLHA